MADFYDPDPYAADEEEAEMAALNLVLCFRCHAWVIRETVCIDKMLCEYYWIGMEPHFVY